MKLTNRQITIFQRKIFSWWVDHRRDLPWRETKDPYRILVSEVMLQQTQVRRVIPKYAEFIEAFPTVKVLSHASPGNVLRVWKGMGYNRRALYLQQIAEAVVRDYGGEFPQDEAQLTKLPGLGRYTARALLVFAFEKDVAMVDTNIRQIITHFFFHDKEQKESVIQDVADRILPVGKSWEWHQALMDYGALELRKLKRPERSRATTIPFKNSNRFYRGRIVDALREINITRNRLVTILAGRYDTEPDRMNRLIDSLKREGLIEEMRSGVLRLPN